MKLISVSRRPVAMVAAVAALVAAVAWTSVASRASAASSTPVVYVATGENFPDALGAGPAAALAKGPILLVSQNAIPAETAAELTRLGPDRIVIVGGTAVVSIAVEDSLKSFAPSVDRIAGANRYDTAAKLSAATYPATLNADTLDGKDSSDFLTSESLRPVAIALIEPEDGRINVATGTGFAGVTRPKAGIYCLALDPGLGVAEDDVFVNVSVEYGNSSGHHLYAYWFDAGYTCAPEEIEIQTFDSKDTIPTDNVAFVVTVFAGPYKSIPVKTG